MFNFSSELEFSMLATMATELLNPPLWSEDCGLALKFSCKKQLNSSYIYTKRAYKNKKYKYTTVFIIKARYLVTKLHLNLYLC